MSKVKYAARIQACPMNPVINPTPVVTWTCSHAHLTQEQAAECSAQEARRAYLPPPQRGRKASREWHTVTVGIKEINPMDTRS